MIPDIKLCTRIPANAPQILIVDATYTISGQSTAADLMRKARQVSLSSGNDFAVFHQDAGIKAYAFLKEEGDEDEAREQARILGDTLGNSLKDFGIEKIYLKYEGKNPSLSLAFAEGMSLGSYVYNKYKTTEKSSNKRVKEIFLHAKDADSVTISHLNILLESVAWARNLVNEPLNKLSAMELAASIKEKLKPQGVRVEVLNKKRIEALRMGGLLSVNLGSIDPPTFSILEWKPENAINKAPLVLVGKGVVFDTGGISLKPPANMDEMKSDMAGAAAVAACLFALASLKLPVYVLALIPATDNRPQGNAYVPGDIITMSDGTSVEVLNTDAEGRLILADALIYAQKFNPDLVITVATLTGAAARATGKYAAPAMHSGAEEWMHQLKIAAEYTRERLVEFPLWKEYEEMIQSDVADVKNVGGAEAGVVTAGLFLKRFTKYPFIHLDIAGTAYLSKRHNYRGKNATGTAVRLLVQFFQQYALPKPLL